MHVPVHVSLYILGNLPEPVTTIDGDYKTVISYEVEEERVKKV